MVVLDRPRETAQRTDLVAVAFACGGGARDLVRLRQRVSAAVGSSRRVVRAHAGIVTAVCELPSRDCADAVEQIRRQVAEELGSASVSAGVARPRKSAATA